MKKIGFLIMTISLLLSCGEKKTEVETTLSGLTPSNFESIVDGEKTALYVLKNTKGAEVCITNWGGRIVSVMVPDRNGKMTDVVLGYDNVKQYVDFPNNNYGGLIGRYGNRIANGKFTLEGKEYQLPQNNNNIHCLHGGPQGYHTRVWKAVQPDAQTVVLSYLSKDGEAGFPGNLNLKVTYKLTEDNALDLRYEAVTDQATVINLTNHSYFNLSGVPGSQILNHKLMINADQYTPVDETLIPKGGVASVENTPMDLRKMIVVGDHIDDDFDQLSYGGGYDHNWVLNTKGDIHQLAAKAVCEKSGIGLEVYTNEPGMQFYAGNAMAKDGKKDNGKHGVLYPHRGAICLETQHFPDTPNHPEFPSVVLRPGEKYFSECIYKFTVEK